MSSESEIVAIGKSLGLRSAHAMPSAKLASSSPTLNTFLEGGLPFGAVTELGLPMGKDARTILCSFLARATTDDPQQLTLWVSGHSECSVYPPAWFARGVNPNKILFSASERPLEQLKRALMNPVFQVIVLDCPKGLKKEDCSFLSRQAHKNGQVIILIRHFFLSNKLGNVWARLRLNIQKLHQRNTFQCNVLKGLSQRELLFAAENWE